jgi:GAF domain-containing protein
MEAGMASAAARTSSTTSSSRARFFPKADAAVLSSEHSQPPKRPRVVGPILDPANLDVPVIPYSPGTHDALYPSPAQRYDPAPVPEKPAACASHKYLRAFMHKNERLRLSMLWYYTRDILAEDEFLRGLQEKVHMAKESTEWDYAIIGILDVNYYIRLATVGVALGSLPRGETLCAHTVTQPPNSVFLLPNMMEDWRFRDSPYVESGGLRAYAGAPLAAPPPPLLSQ